MKAAFTKEACAGVLTMVSLLGIGVYHELTDSHAHSAEGQSRPFVDDRPIVSTEVIGLSSPKPTQARHSQINSTAAVQESPEHTAPHKKRNGAELLGQIFLAGYFTYIAASIGYGEYKRKKTVTAPPRSPEL